MALFTLYRKTALGSWVKFGATQTTNNFYLTGSDIHGTYRVGIEYPLIDYYCLNSLPTLSYDLNKHFVGYWAVYASISTNEVVVGASNSFDISYTFIDMPETGAEQAYDYGEIVKINTSNCKNYNQWWLAIFEEGPIYNRYASKGWSGGTISEVDLSNLWVDYYGWSFEPFHTYTVQFAIENSACPNYVVWNNLDRSFFVCPAGSGCRFGIEEPKISLSPNPVHDIARLQNFIPDPSKEYQLTISDIAGRILRFEPLNTHEIDVSALNNGMFIVNVTSGPERIFTSKLVVIH